MLLAAPSDDGCPAPPPARRLLKDFLWFFLYVLLLLGSCILAYFQISGGNSRFVTVQDALNSMALLTFGFMDYVSAHAPHMHGLSQWQCHGPAY